MDYSEEIRFTCMFERIGEPLYLSPRGHGTTKYLYNLPADHLKPYETQAMVELRKQIPTTTIIVEVAVYHPSVPYDLKNIQDAVPRKSVFSEFHVNHLHAVDDLTRILMGQPSRADFFNACALCRDQVNPHLWVHSFVTAILRRPDMRGFRMPALWEVMPDMFIEGKVWREAIQQSIIPAQERVLHYRTLIINAKYDNPSEILSFRSLLSKASAKCFYRPKDPATNVRHEILSILRSWADRVLEAVDAGFAIQEGGGRVDLRTEKGIEVVTAMWESSFDSPHRTYYGELHNFGHTTIGLLHDPDFRYKERPGPMYFTGTSLRDPVFYRWHKYLDFISQRQKDYLKPYNDTVRAEIKLQWNGIVVNTIQVIRGEDSRLPITLGRVNNLVTFWMQSDIELSRGLDFGRTNLNGLGSVWVRATHLQHLPFTYSIQVTNQTRADVQATVRIFMAPKYDENGDRFPFFEQRILFFEMDKFTTMLHPGENIITQKSENSTLTVPWGQTFREIERDTTSLTRAQAICSCGWPEHLLLPRGKVDGMPFDLFVMLTNTQVDQVPSSRRQLGTLTAKGTCRDSISYCGMIDDKFPDSRPMGFPFDRPAVANEITTLNTFLDDFTSPVSNMASTEIKIFSIDKTIVRGNGAPENSRKIYVAP